LGVDGERDEEGEDRVRLKRTRVNEQRDRRDREQQRDPERGAHETLAAVGALARAARRMNAPVRVGGP
jgi:hypothetical protein